MKIYRRNIIHTMWENESTWQTLIGRSPNSLSTPLRDESTVLPFLFYFILFLFCQNFRLHFNEPCGSSNNSPQGEESVGQPHSATTDDPPSWLNSPPPAASPPSPTHLHRLYRLLRLSDSLVISQYQKNRQISIMVVSRSYTRATLFGLPHRTYLTFLHHRTYPVLHRFTGNTILVSMLRYQMTSIPWFDENMPWVRPNRPPRLLGRYRRLL